MAKTEGKLIANNKKAYHDYFILEKYEAGIVLAGTEVKSLRMGKCSIKESFIRIENGEMYLYGMHISPYEKGNIFNKDPLRVRKLLLAQKGDRQDFRKDERAGEYGRADFRFISKEVLSKWRSGLQKERNFTTSGMILRRKTRNGKHRENLRFGICKTKETGEVASDI